MQGVSWYHYDPRYGYRHRENANATKMAIKSKTGPDPNRAQSGVKIEQVPSRQFVGALNNGQPEK